MEDYFRRPFFVPTFAVSFKILNSMEKLVTIVSVGVYAERQYQKQDGSQENIFIITDIQNL